MLAALAGQTPIASARFAAITQLAVFEAVNSITGQYRSVPGNDIGASGCVGGSAAAAAAHGVLKAYFPARRRRSTRHWPRRWRQSRTGRRRPMGPQSAKRPLPQWWPARGRRVGRPAVLPADFLGPRAVAVDAVVFFARWNLVSLAERHAVRRPGRPSIPAGCSAATHKRGLSEGL